jgi:hypothetical protein
MGWYSLRECLRGRLECPSCIHRRVQTVDCGSSTTTDGRLARWKKREATAVRTRATSRRVEQSRHRCNASSSFIRVDCDPDHMMRCSNCRRTVSAGERVCSFCGEPLDERQNIRPRNRSQRNHRSGAGRVQARNEASAGHRDSRTRGRSQSTQAGEDSTTRRVVLLGIGLAGLVGVGAYALQRGGGGGVVRNGNWSIRGRLANA